MEIEEYETVEYGEDTKKASEEPIVEEEVVMDATVEIAESDKAPEVPERTINPIFVPAIEAKEVPIYDVQGISDADKMMIVKNHMGEIIAKSQIPYIPARVLYRESPNSPPLTAIVKLDHRYVQEAWDYYKVNVKEPNVTEFFEIVRSFTRNPEDVYTRVVDVDLS